MPRCYNAAVCNAENGMGYSNMDFGNETNLRVKQQLKQLYCLSPILQ